MATTEIIARAVIPGERGVLLARHHAKSWHFLPGGHVEPGEQVEAALKREIREELAADSEITGFVGVVEHQYTEDGQLHHELNFVFTVAVPGEPESNEDHLIFDWVPREQLPELDVRPAALKDALLAAAEEAIPFWHPYSE
ncbi:NUDIX domain-containing protein [Nocardia sp. NPDC047038]|uniref:NUDIX hydrolase n=1 Tax=Nocardia sp. NPDC047038 TaxID=3154338 RepID=UPI0033ECF647